MKVSWEHIVDYVRGLASEEVRSAIEANPEAMTRAQLLRHVSLSAQDPVPDMWVNRAKALLPDLPKGRPFLGNLVFESGPAGFRSGAVMARDLKFEFENAVVELRLEPMERATHIQVIGLFTSEPQRAMQVGVLGGNPIECDEFGQFELVIPRDAETLNFVDRMSGDSFLVELT